MLRKLRFYYLLILALLKKEWKKVSLSVLLLLLAVFIFFAFAPFLQSRIAQTTNKLIKPLYSEAVVGKPNTFNPLFSKTESEKEINSLVFRGLMKVSSQGVLESDLAKSFRVKSSTEYEFTLKQDVKWHDGKRFTASDVVYTVKIAQNPLYESELSSNFRDVEVNKVDDYTVVFRLKEPFAPFLTATTVGIIPSHIPLNKYRPVGTGEFRFINVKESEVTLEGAKNKLKFKFYPSFEAALTALKLGEVHGLANFPSQNNGLANWDNFEIEEKVLPFRLVTAFFNLRDEIFADKLVRQAFSYAVPNEELLKIGKGSKGRVALNSFSLLDTLQKEAKEKYLFNLEKTNSNLDVAGWVLAGDGKRYKEGKKLAFSITTVEDSEFEHTALKLKEAWEKVGAEVAVNIVAGQELKNQIVPNRSFSVLLTSQLLNPDPDQYVLWHTTQTTEANVSGITSPKLDKLLEDGRKNLDEKVRREKYQEFARLLLDEAPAIFLYYPRYVWVHSNRITQVDLKNFLEPQDRFAQADSWVINRPIW